jgi:cytochrome c biogenesis protein CcmG/thiol:disulfide interchange protein DsbE
MEVKGKIDEVQTQEPEVIKKSSRQRSITIFVVVSILNAALLVLLWTQLLTPVQKPSPDAPAGTRIAGDINSPLIGKAAPDFTLAKLGESGSLRLSDYKGKPVVLNFWASWCAPCKEEAPFLNKAWETHLKQKGIVLIGIDSQDKTDNALKFLQTYGITYINVQDTPTGDTAINYGTVGFPETIFIDRNGVIVAKYIAPLDEQGLQLELKKLAL